MRRTRLTRRRSGFTLIELLVVMAIIGILAAIGIPQLLKTPIRAKEAALRENLFTFRSCIDQYKADKGKYPESLQTLVDEKYIRKIPIDPVTGSAETWETVQEEAESADTSSAPAPAGRGGPQEATRGIIDVKSGSDKSAIDGTAYNTW